MVLYDMSPVNLGAIDLVMLSPLLHRTTANDKGCNAISGSPGAPVIGVLVILTNEVIDEFRASEIHILVRTKHIYLLSECQLFVSDFDPCTPDELPIVQYRYQRCVTLHYMLRTASEERPKRHWPARPRDSRAPSTQYLAPIPSPPLDSGVLDLLFNVSMACLAVCRMAGTTPCTTCSSLKVLSIQTGTKPAFPGQWATADPSA